jgi:hypothetical protein
VVQLVEKFDCIELESAGRANSLWEGRPRNRASIPGRSKVCTSSPQLPDTLMARPVAYSIGIGDWLPEVKEGGAKKLTPQPDIVSNSRMC